MIAVDLQTENALAALRRATAARHALLDQGMPLAKPAPALSDYRDHLLLLQAWMLPLEHRMESVDQGPRQAGFFPHAPYVTLIAQDLAHPSLSSLPSLPSSAIPIVQHANPWPQHASAAYRWGVCYVVEGSQLGGAVLYRRLAGTLAPHPLHYLQGHGAPGPRWKNFMAALDAAVADEQSVDDACRGACDAFDHLIGLIGLIELKIDLKPESDMHA